MYLITHFFGDCLNIYCVVFATGAFIPKVL